MPKLAIAVTAALAITAPFPSAAGSGQPFLARALPLATAASPLATLAVTNCADSGAGSLRAAIASAADGATIDMSNLVCSTITLTSGSLAVAQNNLTVNGPGFGFGVKIVPDPALSIPLFVHTGTGLLTLSKLIVWNGSNANGNGGCIASSGSVHVDTVFVGYCKTKHQYTADAFFRGGGGIYAHGDLTIDYSLLKGNNAKDSAQRVAGGGAFAAGNLVVRRSWIDGNGAESQINIPGSQALGGGLAAKRDIEITASTISHNTVGGDNNTNGYGGGVFSLDYFSGSTLTITNSTVTYNSSSRYTGGVMSAGTTRIYNSTIAFNDAKKGFGTFPVGVGVFVQSDPLTLVSSILASNTYTTYLTYTNDFSTYQSTVTGSRNLITKSTSPLPPGTLTSNPNLMDLADNGGPTQTHALGAFSPAIGAGGNPLNLPSDQRGPGFARTFSGSVDIGAFQTGDAIFANGLDPPS